jgi:succinate dehydrogenase flavin-adding protein (antitoxin of CptAB toxin-antitoxin module)
MSYSASPFSAPSHLDRTLTIVMLRMQLVNKLLYRSKQRGFLELDLLVGLWAEQHIPQMDSSMLQQFTVVLEQVRNVEVVIHGSVR